ncbi:MAG: hypothetical protein ACHQDY_05680 [Solirubrobacterales bacterium]
MRSYKPVAAGLAAIALLMGAPAGASARKHPSPSGRCRVSIEVAPRQITAGDPVVIFGRLVCRRGAQAGGQTVKLYHHLIGSHSFGFGYVQSTTTDARGFYEFSRADGVVETNRAWYVRSHGARSADRRIRVAAQVSLVGPPEGSQLLTGPANRVTFTGSVNPADVGARVVLQRQNAATGGEWHRIDSSVVQPGGTYSIVHRFIVPGDANIRTLVRSEGRNVPSPSNVLEYEISQAQNPALTIGASANPISFGQPVTITGTLRGGASKPVTLLARTRGQAFAPIALVMSDPSGNYTFPPQTPANSTFYQVTTATQVVCVRAPCPAGEGPLRSAVLFEGVRDVLTAQVSATTVQAGGTLTFTGSVAPSHPGHVLYLERQNASGQGFHVVQLGVMSPNSSFTIVHTVYDAGPKVFRIHIPGGPENQGAVSQLFDIQVTPGPAAALTPEAPSNSGLPAEGSGGSSEGGEGSGGGSEEGRHEAG